MTDPVPAHDRVRRARELIHARFPRRVPLAELADAVGVSPGHLRQAFAAAVGVPPAAYLTRVRVDRAAALLRAGDPGQGRRRRRRLLRPVAPDPALQTAAGRDPGPVRRQCH